MLSQDILPISEKEELSEEQLMIEALYLGLRQSDGLDLMFFRESFHVDFKLYFHTALDRFEAEDWLNLDDKYCRLTVEGMLFLDRIVEELVDLID
jgi:oxygen-independent coproporphyrinogen-3 oxidase